MGEQYEFALPQEPCGATRAEVAAALALLDTDNEKETYTFERGAL